MNEDEMTEAEANAWFVRECARVQGRDDVEEFEQVRRAGGFWTKVWYRPLGFDFMAETTLEVGRGRRRLTAVGESRVAVLERLTEYALEYQYPTGRFPRKRDLAMFYNRSGER